MKVMMTYKKTSIAILILLVIGFAYPVLTYKQSAEKAERLIIVLKHENSNVIERTVEIVNDKLNLSVSKQHLYETMSKILNSESKEAMVVNIDRYLEIYRVHLTDDEYARFVEYMDKKRLYYQDNYDSIKRYLDEYKNNLNSIISGSYMRISGYPNNVLIIEEMKNGSEK